MGSIPTLVGVFLCPCVGPFPSVGLTLTWFIWDRNLALHLTLYSVNSVLESLYGGQFTLSTPLIKPNFCIIFLYSWKIKRQRDDLFELTLPCAVQPVQTTRISYMLSQLSAIHVNTLFLLELCGTRIAHQGLLSRLGA